MPGHFQIDAHCFIPNAPQVIVGVVVLKGFDVLINDPVVLLHALPFGVEISRFLVLVMLILMLPHKCVSNSFSLLLLQVRC